MEVTEQEGVDSQVVFPCIWITHLALRPVSLELNGRTRTATFTDAPAIARLRPPHLREANQRAESDTDRRTAAWYNIKGAVTLMLELGGSTEGGALWET